MLYNLTSTKISTKYLRTCVSELDNCHAKFFFVCGWDEIKHTLWDYSTITLQKIYKWPEPYLNGRYCFNFSALSLSSLTKAGVRKSWASNLVELRMSKFVLISMLLAFFWLCSLRGDLTKFSLPLFDTLLFKITTVSLLS